MISSKGELGLTKEQLLRALHEATEAVHEGRLDEAKDFIETSAVLLEHLVLLESTDTPE